jgi:hypothetical protein
MLAYPRIAKPTVTTVAVIHLDFIPGKALADVTHAPIGTAIAA